MRTWPVFPEDVVKILRLVFIRGSSRRLQLLLKNFKLWSKCWKWFLWVSEDCFLYENRFKTWVKCEVLHQTQTNMSLCQKNKIHAGKMPKLLFILPHFPFRRLMTNNNAKRRRIKRTNFYLFPSFGFYQVTKIDSSSLNKTKKKILKSKHHWQKGQIYRMLWYKEEILFVDQNVCETYARPPPHLSGPRFHLVLKSLGN